MKLYVKHGFKDGNDFVIGLKRKGKRENDPGLLRREADAEHSAYYCGNINAAIV